MDLLFYFLHRHRFGILAKVLMGWSESAAKRPRRTDCCAGNRHQFIGDQQPAATLNIRYVITHLDAMTRAA